MIDHPVFRRFAHYKDYSKDWLGARFASEVVGNERVPAWSIGPDLNEELFEWISMLQAVLWAGERFVMLELGAGFGRWGIWGAMAAKAVGINDICVRLVEAEPQHSSWAAESIRLNGLEREVTLIEGAISNALEPVPFFIDVPAEALQATSWWGQSVNRPNEPTKLSGETYFGYPVYRNDYCGQIYVPPITIERAIEGLDLVDLIDVDLQEAEIELLDWMDLLTAKVRMIHFGTHRLDIEKALREAFQRWGWICQWDFSLLGERETPFGLIGFEDGVQTWINPNLPGANDKVLMRQLQQELSALQATATGTAGKLESLQAQHDSIRARVDTLVEGIQSWLLPTIAKHSAAIERRQRPFDVFRDWRRRSGK